MAKLSASLFEQEGGGSQYFSGLLKPDGTFVREAAPCPGHYKVEVSCEGWTWKTGDWLVPEEGPAELVITRPKGDTVSGVLLGSEGEPVAAAVIRLCARVGAEKREGKSSSIGTFHVDLVSPGRYAIEIDFDNETLRQFTDELDVQAGGIAGVTLRLPGGSIAGRLVGCLNPQRKIVKLQEREGDGWFDKGQVRSQKDGAFLIRGLSAGLWRLRTISDRGVERQDGWAPPVELPLNSGEAITGCEIPWRPCPAIEIVLRSPSGSALPARLDGVADPVPRERWGCDFELTPDPAGKCTVSTIPPGRYELQIWSGRQLRASREIAVVDGENPPIEATLSD